MPVVNSWVGRDQLQRDGTRSVHLYFEFDDGVVERRVVYLGKDSDAAAALALHAAKAEEARAQSEASRLPPALVVETADLEKLLDGTADARLRDELAARVEASKNG